MNSRLSSADRFALFAQRFCGLQVEDFQRTIANDAFSDRRELLVLLPRGNGKTTLFAAVGLFALLSTPEPAIYVCAASRDQARLLFEQAKRMVRGHPELEARVTARYSELRANGGFLKVVASDAPLAHGLTPSHVFVDELHAHRDAELYLAMRTSMLKRPEATLKVGDALLLTANALMTTYAVLGGTLEDALGLDPEHVALAGTLALLSGADELYAAPEAQA